MPIPPECRAIARSKFMKIHAAVLVMLLTMLAAKPVAQSQCTTPVLRWLGKYTVSGTEPSGKSADGFTYQVNESAAANVYTTAPDLTCSQATWFSNPDRSPTTSINDSGVATCPPNSAKPQETIAI